jgi:hypothetical protein
MQIILLIIWLIFSALFFTLAIWHWKQSKHAIPPLEVTIRKFERPGSQVKVKNIFSGTSLDKPLKDFADDFNKYLEKQNKSNRKMNQRTALGYFLASLTALASMIVEIASFRSQ